MLAKASAKLLLFFDIRKPYAYFFAFLRIFLKNRHLIDRNLPCAQIANKHPLHPILLLARARLYALMRYFFKKILYNLHIWHIFCTFAADFKNQPNFKHMKKSFWVIVMAMMAVVGMAQHHHSEPDGRGHRGGHHGHATRQEIRYIPCASAEQVAMALKTIENQSFDDKKLEIAKLCVTLAPFEVRDLARIVASFSFDDKRKEFLIYAYSNCCDPENYYLLRDSFSFRSNFDEMMEAVLPGYRR